MAYSEGKRGGFGERAPSQDHIVEKIEPSAAWTYDAENHYLLVDLPDFKKEQVRLEVDESNQIKVSGERLGKDKDKYFYFEKTFKVPENSDINNITGKFDGEILCVTVGKQVQVRSKEVAHYNEDNHGHETINSSAPVNYNQPTNPTTKEEFEPGRANGGDNKWGQVDEFDIDMLRRWADEITPFGRAIEVMKRNKGILITALLAFSIGVLVSHRIGSSPGGLGQDN